MGIIKHPFALSTTSRKGKYVFQIFFKNEQVLKLGCLLLFYIYIIHANDEKKHAFLMGMSINSRVELSFM